MKTGSTLLIKSKDLLLILLLSLLWSFSFLFIRICVSCVEPIALTFYRLCYAFGFMLIIAICTKARIFSYWKHIHKLLASSFFLNAVPFTLCAVGEVAIDSSTTGIIEGSTPIFVLLFSWLIFRESPISFRQVRAIFMGFLGLLIVFYPFISAGSLHQYYSLLALIGMAVSFAFGFSFSEKYLKPVPPIEAVTLQLFFAPFMILPFVFLKNGFIPTIPLQMHGILSILGITSSLGWVTYFYALKRTSAINVSISTMIIPIITIVWGRIFLAEEITWNKVLGTIVVIGSLSILWNFHGHCINQIKKSRNRKK